MAVAVNVRVKLKLPAQVIVVSWSVQDISTSGAAPPPLSVASLSQTEGVDGEVGAAVGVRGEHGVGRAGDGGGRRGVVVQLDELLEHVGVSAPSSKVYVRMKMPTSRTHPPLNGVSKKVMVTSFRIRPGRR